MDIELQIANLIREGAASPEQAEQLRAALQESIADDAVVKAQIEASKSTKRRRRALSLISLFSVLCIIGVIFSFVVLKPNTLTVAPPALDRAEDINQTILSLETRLKKPGSYGDYNQLAEAYQSRFEQSGDKSDLLNAERARSRAQRLFHKQHKEGVMAKTGIVFGILFIILIAAGVGMAFVLPYNGLARKDEMVDARWAQVETVLQRRLDLIPNLVEGVKGYANHEKETLLAVTEARAKMLTALGADQGKDSSAEKLKSISKAEKGLSLALSRLFAVAEQYPQIKASSNFLALQDQLEGTENRISVERHRYNEAVKNYNSGLRTFPSNVVGSIFDFDPRAYFESDLGAEKAVAVDFSK